ncbi:MAG: RHS repeat-associated core domain-containing protein, partial [Spirochaetota bacterium]
FCKSRGKHGWQKKWYWFCRHCWKDWQGGDLVDRPDSYKLEIDPKDRKAYFTLFTERNEKPRHTRKISVHTDEEIPTEAWVHLAGVYTGDKLVLYVNGVKQSDEKAASGEVKEGGAVLRLGGLRCDSKLEEVRISGIARTQFSGSQAVKETVLRSVFWNGWQVVEERERTAEVGQPLGEEKVVRQFTDSAGIDEHICVEIYGPDGASVEKTYWFHQNHRGDTVAITDETGSVVKRYSYSSYGEPYEVDDNGNLTPVEDLAFLIYGFQGLAIDEETGYLYVRNRYYSAQQGRWLSRDITGYQDSLNLYESFGENPIVWQDPFGLQKVETETHTGYTISQAEELLTKYQWRSLSNDKKREYCCHFANLLSKWDERLARSKAFEEVAKERISDQKVYDAVDKKLIEFGWTNLESEADFQTRLAKSLGYYDSVSGYIFINKEYEKKAVPGAFEYMNIGITLDHELLHSWFHLHPSRRPSLAKAESETTSKDAYNTGLILKDLLQFCSSSVIQDQLQKAKDTWYFSINKSRFSQIYRDVPNLSGGTIKAYRDFLKNTTWK